jgi:hypothetical protein
MARFSARWTHSSVASPDWVAGGMEVSGTTDTNARTRTRMGDQLSARKEITCPPTGRLLYPPTASTS